MPWIGMDRAVIRDQRQVGAYRGWHARGGRVNPDGSRMLNPDEFFAHQARLRGGESAEAA